MINGYKKKTIKTELTKEMIFNSMEENQLLTLVTAGNSVIKGTVETVGYANTSATAFNIRLIGREKKCPHFFGMRGYVDIENPNNSWLEVPENKYH